VPPSPTEPIFLFPRPRTRTRDRLGPSPGELVNPPALPTGDTRRRVSRLLLLRTIVVSVVLGLSLWLVSTAEQPSKAAVWLQSSIIAATYLSSIVFGVMLRRGMSAASVARPMQAADLLVTSLLVFVTGGALSPYPFLYALSIVAAGALSYRRGAVVVTVASLIAFFAVAVLAWTHAIELPGPPQVRPWEQTGAELIRTLGINVAALIGVGALAFIFGDQLQKGAETLATTRRAAADLLTLHEDIVRSLSSGLITTSPEGVVLTANHAAAEILHEHALAGRSIDELMPGLTALLADTNQLRRADLAIGELTIGVTVSPLRDLKNQEIGRVINFQDLTDLRRLEGHVQRAERLATVGQLAAGIAHEIRNPLASISGSVELLRSSPQTSDDDRTLMTIVHREIQRLNVLIGDLLDYANPRPKEAVDFDLAVLIAETLQVARGDDKFSAVELTSEVPPRLSISADPSKLRQVLWNLLRNAADAAADGGKHVRVAAASEHDCTVIVVEDDGPGIPRDQISRIFDPFFTTKRRGTGLGLATCHAVVAEHGGRIDVDSSSGKGTRMIVRLPWQD
jgi:two-component system sensor histidine kinase PilS (NtrC family)